MLVGRIGNRDGDPHWRAESRSVVESALGATVFLLVHRLIAPNDQHAYRSAPNQRNCSSFAGLVRLCLSVAFFAKRVLTSQHAPLWGGHRDFCSVMLHIAAEEHRANPEFSASISGMDQNRWHLDPSRFPKRLDLELSETALRHLQAISERTGRSVRELAEHFLCQALFKPDTY